MVSSLNSLQVLLFSQAGIGSYSYNFCLTGPYSDNDKYLIDVDKAVNGILGQITSKPVLSVNGPVYKSEMNKQFMKVPYRSALMGKEGVPLLTQLVDRIVRGYPNSAISLDIWPDTPFSDTLNILGLELVVHVDKLELVVHQSTVNTKQAIFTLKVFYKLLEYITNLPDISYSPGRVRHHIGNLIK